MIPGDCAMFMFLDMRPQWWDRDERDRNMPGKEIKG